MGIASKIKKIICFPYRSITYKHFEMSSDIEKVLMFSGKKYTSIHNKVLIRKNARIEVLPINNSIPELILEDGVTIEQGLHLTCSSKMVIGQGTTISSYVYISDTAHSYDKIMVDVLKQDHIIKPVSIGKYCFIGTGVKIMPGVTIGDNVIIGANSVVTHDIESFSVIAGIPAKVIKKFDSETEQWVSRKG